MSPPEKSAAAPSPADAWSGVLPPLYARWTSELLPEPVPLETDSTCSSCAMVARPGFYVDRSGEQPKISDYAFDATVKCCSVVPVLPNFLVGRILRMTHPEGEHGRATVRARLTAKAAVTPFGVGQTDRYHSDYQQRSGRDFGRSAELRCPHFVVESSGCSIWENRNGTCATYFCKPVRGVAGADFWVGALKPLFKNLEASLAQWAALEVGLSDPSLQTLFSFRKRSQAAAWSDLCDAQGAVDEAAYRQAWGSWQGREEDFFRACAAEVDALSFEDVQRIGGAPLAVSAQLAKSSHQRLLAVSLPQRLKLGFYSLIEGAGRDRFVTYDLFDVVDVPAQVTNFLGVFDGTRDTALALKMAAQACPELTPALVQKLVDNQILVEA